MLKKQFIIGLLLTFFTLVLSGIALADDAGHDNFNEKATVYIQQDTMADAEITQPTAIELEHGNLDVRSGMNDSEPAVCDADLAPGTKQFASNECADLYEDLYRS